MRIWKVNRIGNSQRGWSLVETLAAIVVVGIGITLFAKVQRMSNRDSTVNSKILIAGKMIENHIEDRRISIAQNPTTNFPPGNITINAAAPNYIKIVSTVSSAYSPKDGALVADVKKLDIVASWTSPYADSLKVTTYVSKKF